MKNSDVFDKLLDLKNQIFLLRSELETDQEKREVLDDIYQENNKTPMSNIYPENNRQSAESGLI